MKTDFPKPHNPEQAILDPGYRFLGIDEPVVKSTDELLNHGMWQSAE